MSKEFKRVNIPPCPWHTMNNLSYLAAHEDASKRTTKGETQKQCPVCAYWFWPDQFGTDPMTQLNTEREYVIMNTDTKKTCTVIAASFSKACDKAHKILKSGSVNNYTEVK